MVEIAKNRRVARFFAGLCEIFARNAVHRLARSTQFFVYFCFIVDRIIIFISSLIDY